MTVTQDQFTAAVLDPSAGVPETLIGPDGGPAGRRFDVYRNNVAVSLTEALETAFPAIARLLGEENFKGLSGMFLRQHPPSAPLMMFYGAEMPAFLAGMPQLDHLPYLPDVARLELALRHAYHAADAEILNPADLSIPPSDLMSAHLRPHPAARVIASPWPIHDIWRFNMVRDAPKPVAGAQNVLITRPEFDTLQTLLPKGGDAFFAALANGEAFGAAVDAAQRSEPTFDLSAALTACLSAGAFSKLET